MQKSIFILVLSMLALGACSPVAAAPSPSPHPTATTALAPTQTTTPTQTPTPTPTPTFQFYANDIPLSATAASCAVPPARMCLSGLTIRLSGRVLSQYALTITSSRIPETTINCPEKFVIENFGDYTVPVNCDSTGITLVAFGLKEITLKIVWQSGSSTQTFEPDYEPYAINGPECDPVCSVASIEMKIP